MDRDDNNQNNNQWNHWFWDQPVGFFTTPRTIANLGIDGGISYTAYRGAVSASSGLAGAPIYVRTGAFVGVYAGIFITRKFLGVDPVNNFFIVFGNNNGGNRFNSPLEYGEALNEINNYMEGLIALLLCILLLFNILIMVLANRTIIPYILKWLEVKLSVNSLIYRFIERTYKANMKVSIWLMIFIIVFIYIFLFIELWGLSRMRIVFNLLIEYINYKSL